MKTASAVPPLDASSSSEDHKLRSLKIKVLLRERGVTEELIAEGTLLDLGTVRNLLNGSAKSDKGRQRITNFVGCELWPGIKPQPVALPLPSDEQRALVDATLPKLAPLSERFRQTESDEEQEALTAEAEPLLTPEFRTAVALIMAECRIGMMSRICRDAGFFLFGPAKPADADGYVRVKIGRSPLAS